MMRETDFTQSGYDEDIYRMAQFLVIDHDLQPSDLEDRKIATFINEYLKNQLPIHGAPPFLKCVRYSNIRTFCDAIEFSHKAQKTDNLSFVAYFELFHRAILGADIAENIRKQLLTGDKQS